MPESVRTEISTRVAERCIWMQKLFFECGWKGTGVHSVEYWKMVGDTVHLARINEKKLHTLEGTINEAYEDGSISKITLLTMGKVIQGNHTILWLLKVCDTHVNLVALAIKEKTMGSFMVCG